MDINLLDLLINKTVEIAMAEGVLKSKSIIVDATHTKSRYNQKSAQEELLERAKNLRKTLYGVKPEIKEELPTKVTTGVLEDNGVDVNEVIGDAAYSEKKNLEYAKSKTYSVSIKSDIHKDQLEFEKSEYFKKRARERYMIEAKNSELKHQHSYDVATSSVLIAMQMQGALSIFTVNLNRIIKLNGFK